MERRRKTWNEAQRKNEGKEDRSRNWGGNKPRSEQRGRKREMKLFRDLWKEHLLFSSYESWDSVRRRRCRSEAEREEDLLLWFPWEIQSEEFKTQRLGRLHVFRLVSTRAAARTRRPTLRWQEDEQGGNTDGKHEADGHLIPSSWSQLDSIIKSSRLNAVCCVLYFKHQENQQQASWTHVCASVLWKDLQLAPTWPLTPSESADFCWVVYLMTPCKVKKLSQQTCAIRGHTSAFFYIWHRGRLLTPTPSGSKWLTTAVLVTWLWRKWRRDFIFRLRLWVGGKLIWSQLIKNTLLIFSAMWRKPQNKNCKQHKKVS